MKSSMMHVLIMGCIPNSYQGYRSHRGYHARFHLPDGSQV